MSTYLEREREKLAALDAELRDLDTSRSDRAFIERLAAPGSFTAEPPRTSAELNAQRTKDWEVWLRARLDAERLALFDAIAESMAKLDRRIRELESKQQRSLDGEILDPLPIRKIRIGI